MRQIFVTGGVTIEPQEKVSQKTGVSYLEFSIASQEYNEQSPTYFTVRVLNDRLRNIVNSLKKGNNVIVTGDYQDSAYCKDGNAMVGRYITAHSVSFAGGNGGGQKGNGNYQKKQGGNNYSQGGGQQQGHTQPQPQATAQPQYAQPAPQQAQMTQQFVQDNDLPF